MSSRFSLRRAPVPASAPETPPETAPVAVQSTLLVPTSQPAEPKEKAPPASDNPLLSDKFLDAKVRLHRKLIEEINLSALEKLPEDEMRAHIQQARHAVHRDRAAGAQHP